MSKLSEYPVQIEINPDERVARWRVFFAGFLVIPLYIIVAFFGYLIQLLWFFAFVVIIIKGKIPKWILEADASYLRYQLRIATVMLFLRNDYPPFGFDFQIPDPGDDPHIVVTIPEEQKRSRLLSIIFIRLLLLVPHIIALMGAGVIAGLLTFLSWFFAVFAGRWPKSLQRIVIAVLKYSSRLTAYMFYVTDKYPPFAIA